MRFTTQDIIPVTQPYRLDVTVDALRRLAANVVDVVGSDDAFYRALPSRDGLALVRVVQVDDASLEVQTTARDARTILATVRKMLGTTVDLHLWETRVADIPWLARIRARHVEKDDQNLAALNVPKALL